MTYKWGTYLAERQWGTVREDYSAEGDAWNYFPHDHARSRVYRWGEDGLAGWSDDQQRLCFALAFWNGKDPILKERLFGLTNGEGNHGEDVKELYYYEDNTPTHDYARMRYLYPQAEFPYRELVEINAQRGRLEPEYELTDTGIFKENRYFDVAVEYAKAAANDICIQITIRNCGPESAPIWVLPTLWFRNRWSFGIEAKPGIEGINDNAVLARHANLGDYLFCFEKAPNHLLFTENETNTERLFNSPNASAFVKDLFHNALTNNEFSTFEHKKDGTKCSPVYQLTLAAGETAVLRFCLTEVPAATTANAFYSNRKAFFDAAFEATLQRRKLEADTFYTQLFDKLPGCIVPAEHTPAHFQLKRHAFAGLLWCKQFYEYDVARWLDGDPGNPPPPASRKNGRNSDWRHLKAADVMLMPDTWEYPWFAAWDLAFHALALAPVDPGFAQEQLLLLTNPRYMTAAGDLPAYEWRFDDLNPPVQAWAAWQVYRQTNDRIFLQKIFDGLLPHVEYWEKMEDDNGNSLFEGGFLGLDNISLFDRSQAIPDGGKLEQSDGTGWAAFQYLFMLRIALELSETQPQYSAYVRQFFERFERIAEALHAVEEAVGDDFQGFYFDLLTLPDGACIPLRVHSFVGLVPLFAGLSLGAEDLAHVPDFADFFKSFLQKNNVSNGCIFADNDENPTRYLLSFIPPDRLEKVLSAVFDSAEMLAEYGIRSVSKRHETGITVDVNGTFFEMRYVPGESDSSMFGGNSNWRGPIWLPVNFLLVDTLRRYYVFFGDTFTLEVPAGSGRRITLCEAADELCRRLLSLFLPDENGYRILHGAPDSNTHPPDFQDNILFYEYFHADSGRGLGASHQTGWTALVGML